jgi:hypothetical protein
MPLIQGSVLGTSISTAKVSSGSTSQNFSQGNQGELLVSEYHSQLGMSCYAGALFSAGTAVAGVTLPVSTTTTATFCFYNPQGSGVFMELVEVACNLISATGVINAIGLGCASGQSTPTTTTVAPSLGSNRIGGANPAGTVYTSAGITATTRFIWSGMGMSVTNSTGFNNFFWAINGKVVLPPGGLAHLVVSTGAQANMVVGGTWLEHPYP